jgi:hypothetical protein
MTNLTELAETSAPSGAAGVSTGGAAEVIATSVSATTVSTPGCAGAGAPQAANRKTASTIPSHFFVIFIFLR